MSLRELTADLVTIAKDNSLTDNAIRYNPTFYDRTRETIRLSRSDPDQAIRLSGALLERALSWARETAYGRRYGPDLGGWPILSKSDVIASPARFRRRGTLGIPAATSGSTGHPLPLVRSAECVSAEQAFMDSYIEGNRRSMLERRVAVLRADHVKDPDDPDPPFGVLRNRRRRLILSSFHLSSATFPWYLDALTSFEPEVLWVYPSTVSNLLRLCEEAGARLSVPIVLSSSEVLSEGLFCYVRDFLQARVIDQYGHAERLCSAYCDSTREYRFDSAYGYVELLPDPPGDTNGGTPATAKIIATGFWNSAFPLVRYDTGDRVVLPEGGADDDVLREIAEGRRGFPAIIGRADDYVIGCGGQRITGINHIPREVPSVLRAQVIQEDVTRIRILVIPKGELTRRDRRKLERNARALLPPYMELEIEVVGELITLPNGKTPFIVREPSAGADTDSRRVH